MLEECGGLCFGHGRGLETQRACGRRSEFPLTLFETVQVVCVSVEGR
jgi:hypothetical protein